MLNEPLTRFQASSFLSISKHSSFSFRRKIKTFAVYDYEAPVFAYSINIFHRDKNSFQMIFEFSSRNSIPNFLTSRLRNQD